MSLRPKFIITGIEGRLERSANFPPTAASHQRPSVNKSPSPDRGELLLTIGNGGHDGLKRTIRTGQLMTGPFSDRPKLKTNLRITRPTTVLTEDDQDNNVTSCSEETRKDAQLGKRICPEQMTISLSLNETDHRTASPKDEPDKKQSTKPTQSASEMRSSEPKPKKPFKAVPITMDNSRDSAQVVGSRLKPPPVGAVRAKQNDLPKPSSEAKSRRQASTSPPPPSSVQTSTASTQTACEVSTQTEPADVGRTRPTGVAKEAQTAVVGRSTSPVQRQSDDLRDGISRQKRRSGESWARSPLEGYAVGVTGLGSWVTEQDLTDLFTQFGAVKRIKQLPPDGAVVTFVQRRHAVDSVKMCHLRKLDDCMINCILLDDSSSSKVTDTHQDEPVSHPAKRRRDDSKHKIAASNPPTVSSAEPSSMSPAPPTATSTTTSTTTSTAVSTAVSTAISTATTATSTTTSTASPEGTSSAKSSPATSASTLPIEVESVHRALFKSVVAPGNDKRPSTHVTFTVRL